MFAWEIKSKSIHGEICDEKSTLRVSSMNRQLKLDQSNLLELFEQNPTKSKHQNQSPF